MNLATEQKKDPDLARMNPSNNCSPTDKKRFELVKGTLCKKNFDPDGKLGLPQSFLNIYEPTYLDIFITNPPQDILA
ncbi:hypothetical protein TNIN_270651 [Trichonephila inaurata madagascariensis]|uniref:Uncharacterized protein n=1 Tax=Trichonephila inaurata madagascariensis TaxID=2747483 RepID=A0A8X6WQN8_9ARAC|nr:hypothetical protein TNIN_270651 [Trichonephila inaurata madagascariensis]